jgi:hypothetical protein
MKTLPVGTHVLLHTDDSLDGLAGIVAEVLTTKPAKNELTYRIEYVKPNGEKDVTYFRAHEVMMTRDQPLTNHGAF